MPPASPPGRIAGIDFGTVRIGVAVSDADRTLASPLETYRRAGQEADADYFRDLVQREQITRFVVGLPVHGSGHESEKSREARQFGRWLGEVTGVDVDFHDERYTSLQADELLRMGNLTKKKRQSRRDMLAAQIMLASYLESSPGGAAEPGPLEDQT
jgi:putative Holliday junction resolvase